MKIRNGFVSNSSSSSFVVIFPKIPKNANDVRDILFSPEDIYFHSNYGDEKYAVDDVAKTVWDDICDQEANDYAKVKSEIMSGHLDDFNAPDYNDFYHIKDLSQRWKAYDDACEEFANKKMKEFLNLRKRKLKKINNEEIDDMPLYVFEYSDNDGEYFSTLEHGNLFNKLKHIRISKH